MITTRVDDGEIVVSHGAIELARYVHRPDPSQFEAPKPYLHPLRTLSGDIVTNYRPHDHRWHKGLQLTCTDLSGHNLWGGNTYVEGRGYVALDNVGSMVPIGEIVTVTDALGGAACLDHELRWRTAKGADLVAERRSLRFSRVNPALGAWSLEWHSELQNVTGTILSFGSPATRGLAGSGYSGLWWRGPRSFTGGRVVSAAGDTSAAAARGTDAAWLAFISDHDGVDRSSTLLFEPIIDDARFETRWFVRSEEFAAVNPSWAFDRTFELRAGESARVGYRITIVDGAWNADEIEEWRRGDAR
jgi:hypothetical protein